MAIELTEGLASNLAVVAAIPLGVLAVGTACFNWVRHQVFGLAGSSLCIVGVLMMGLSIWQTVHLKLNKDSIEADIQKQSEEVGKKSQIALQVCGQSADVAKNSAKAAATAATVSDSPDAPKAVQEAKKAVSDATAARAAVEKASEKFHNLVNSLNNM